jgi:hypothetical protein
MDLFVWIVLLIMFFKKIQLQSHIYNTRKHKINYTYVERFFNSEKKTTPIYILEE